MGIRDLNNFLKRTAPESIKNVHLSELRGKRVAIDTSIYFYKFLYKNPRFIESFFQQISRLRTHNITPIYVFDGKPPEQKRDEIISRKNKKDEYKNKIKLIKEQLENIDKEPTIPIDNNIIGEVTEEDVPKTKAQLEEDLRKYTKKLIYVF